MTKLSKNTVSIGFTIIFCLTLGIGALVSEFFQAPILSSKELSKLQFLYTNSDFEKISKLNLKSNLGEFNLAKEDKNTWMMTTPRSINVNSEIITKILKALEDIKIKKIYPSDQINIANFSLDKPVATLTITDDQNEVKVLSFGLINPIDSSTYLQVKGENVIYHINVLDFPLEKLDVTSLIDTQIFSSNISSITELKIFPPRTSIPSFSVSKKDNEWSSGNLKLDTASLVTFIEEIKAMKAHIILDQIDENMTLEKEKIFQNSSNKIEVTEDNGNVITYDISMPFNSLTNVKVEKRQNILIRASNRKHVFVVNKDYLKLFSKKVNQLKENPIKKLIY